MPEAQESDTFEIKIRRPVQVNGQWTCDFVIMRNGKIPQTAGPVSGNRFGIDPLEAVTWGIDAATQALLIHMDGEAVLTTGQ